MNRSVFWKNYDRITNLLEAIGLLLIVIGPLLGLGLMVFGDTVLRLFGTSMLFGSGLLALYHFSFSYLMKALRVQFFDSAGPEEEIAGDQA